MNLLSAYAVLTVIPFQTLHNLVIQPFLYYGGYKFGTWNSCFEHVISAASGGPWEFCMSLVDWFGM